MRLLRCCVWCLVAAASAPAAEPAIKKVLPHYLDQQGRHTLSPSLYERDAYQAYLRDHPEARSALRFDILCRAPASTNLKLRVDIRGTKELKPTLLQASSSLQAHKGGRRWYHVTIPAQDYERVGRMLAWKVSLVEGESELARQASFLWQSGQAKTEP